MISEEHFDRGEVNAITGCGISESRNFESVWNLPAYPLTERFGPFRGVNAWSFDQELIMSMPTGHVQLRNRVSPTLLYSAENYAFRTATSSSSRGSVTFFLRYLGGVLAGRSFRTAVDIGGNDLSVARALLDFADTAGVVDPVCAAQHGDHVDGIKVLGRFVEEIDLSAEFDQLDLVVCRHTLEHLANPRDFLMQLFKQCSPDCLFVFEVPCLTSLIEGLRFDAIIHQHYHYFDLYSFTRLLWECGGEYINHEYNHQGSNGGALLVTFRRARSTWARPEVEFSERLGSVKSAISRFVKQTEVLADQLASSPPPVFGYGASLMLATLAYHLKTDFRSLECVLDDDPVKHGQTYENLPVQIFHTQKIKPAPGASYIITSLENSRIIYERIVDLSPRRILTPIVT